MDPALMRWCREQFPALAREENGQPVVYFDGPAGTQVPERVIEAIGHYLRTCNANHDGLFPTGRESDAILEKTHQAAADFVGASDPGEIVFGPNMTTLTFAMSRSIARTWQSGDEVVVTRLDHDANVTPWVMAAEDAGATVRKVGIRADDCTLDLEQLEESITERTRLVAIGCASNSVGTVTDVRRIADRAHAVGALVYMDAVHLSPHRLPDVEAMGADFLACSVYKFFGPHIGVLWGKRELLESLQPYKVRPATETIPGRWMNGTQNHECLAGTLAAIDYLADLGREFAGVPLPPRRDALAVAYGAIRTHEDQLAKRLLAGLSDLEPIRVWGITDPDRIAERVPTFSITSSRETPAELASRLGDHGVFVWNGHYYALELSEALGREPDGMVRIGLVHYNTADEVDRLLELLS